MAATAHAHHVPARTTYFFSGLMAALSGDSRASLHNPPQIPLQNSQRSLHTTATQIQQRYHNTPNGMTYTRIDQIYAHRELVYHEYEYIHPGVIMSMSTWDADYHEYEYKLQS